MVCTIIRQYIPPPLHVLGILALLVLVGCSSVPASSLSSSSYLPRTTPSEPSSAQRTPTPEDDARTTAQDTTIRT